MSALKIEVAVFQGAETIWSGVAKAPLEIGRQQETDSGSLQLQDSPSGQRLVIAPLTTRSLPRKAIQVDSTATGGLRLTNIHSAMAFHVEPPSQQFAPGDSVIVHDSIRVLFPEGIAVQIAAQGLGSRDPPPDRADKTTYRTLSRQTIPITNEVAPVGLNELFGKESESDRARVAVELVRSALTVVQQAAGSNEFFDSAVRAVATMVELDRALVLMREGDGWKVRSSYTNLADTSSTETKTDESFSHGLTQRVLDTGQTVIYDPIHQAEVSNISIALLDRAVATPIFNERHDVIGAIYGDRKLRSDTIDSGIGDLEAALLEVMAGAVASGIARQRQESMRSSLSQFFSNAVAKRLEENEDLLAGREADVSVMFCDIRGFSGIAERIGARLTIEWINDVLTELSHCVTKTDGVLVDYIGDELMAMWGAPADQPDHARRACESALEMLKLVEPLRRRWIEVVPEQFGIGIGINSGIAQVGNTGSAIKFKYGPLGNMVNLASRIQGVTRKLGVEALIADETAQAIGNEFDHRSLGLIRPLGIAEPIGIHELKSNATGQWRDMAERYESALKSFGSNHLTAAARQLASLIDDHPEDDPSIVLLGRVVDGLTKHQGTVDTVWKLDSK
jgi:adenylate cyclase